MSRASGLGSLLATLVDTQLADHRIEHSFGVVQTAVALPAADIMWSCCPSAR